MAEKFDWSEEAEKAFVDRLNKGVLSPDAVELFKIATPRGSNRYDLENGHCRKLEEYLQSIVNRLLNTEFARAQLLHED